VAGASNYVREGIHRSGDRHKTGSPATRNAGLDIGRVEIGKDGKISIVPREAAGAGKPTSWDDAQWQAALNICTRIATVTASSGIAAAINRRLIKIAAVVLVIAAGLPHMHPVNWHPFMPYGFGGVVEGAAVIFFAVFGYDTLTTAAEEARDPQQQLPRAVLLSLAI
jgi:hypothetical protein